MPTLLAHTSLLVCPRCVSNQDMELQIAICLIADRDIKMPQANCSRVQKISYIQAVRHPTIFYSYFVTLQARKKQASFLGQEYEQVGTRARAIDFRLRISNNLLGDQIKDYEIGKDTQNTLDKNKY